MNSKRRYSYSGNLTTAHWDRYSFNYTCVIKSSCFLSYWCDVRYAPGTTSPWQKATAGNFLSAESSLMRATYRSYKLREIMPDCWRWYQQHAIPLEVHVKLISFMSLMLKVMSDVSHCHLFPHLFELFFLFLFPPSLEVHLKLIRCMIFRLKFMLDVSHFHLLPSIWTSSFFLLSLEVHLQLVRFMIFRFKVMVDVSHLHLFLRLLGSFSPLFPLVLFFVSQCYVVGNPTRLLVWSTWDLRTLSNWQ